MQVTCPQNPHRMATQLPGRPPHSFINYHDASNLAELESTFRQGADTWAKHLVTSAAGRAATFGMILIVQGFQIPIETGTFVALTLCILRNLQRTSSQKRVCKQRK